MMIYQGFDIVKFKFYVNLMTLRKRLDFETNFASIKYDDFFILID